MTSNEQSNELTTDTITDTITNIYSDNITSIIPRFELSSINDRSMTMMDNVENLMRVLILDNVVDVYMPNTIFDDLQKANTTSTQLNWQQQAFSYAYYYLTSYLYRNCVHAKVEDINTVNLTAIKRNLMGMGGNTLNFIIKKDGVLDQLGYTFTTNDIPIYAEFDKDTKRFKGFDTLSKVKARTGSRSDALNYIPPKFQIKMPLKGFYSHLPTSYSDLLELAKTDNEAKEMLEYYDGHFYDVVTTHKIQIETFIACMANPVLSYKGFYLYGFYRMQSDRHKHGYKITIENLLKVMRIDRKTLQKYNTELEKMNLIKKINKLHHPSTYIATSHVPVINV